MNFLFFRLPSYKMQILWREWLTAEIVELYLDGRTYLKFSNKTSLSNPDQRVSEDVRSFTASSISFFLMLTNSSITAISFSGVLWAIHPNLFLASVVYAISGSMLTFLLGRPLLRLNYQQADYEADFRTELIRVHENAHEISATGSEAAAKERLLEKLGKLSANLQSIFCVNRNVGFFTVGYNYMIQLIPILLVAPIFIRQGVDFGIIGQSSIAFATMVGALSLIINQFNSISAYAAVITRLSEFVETAEQTGA